MGALSSHANVEENAHCGGEIAPLWINIMSFFMIIAIICSYVPKVLLPFVYHNKHYRIIRLRSSKGYSHYYFLLGFSSSASTLVTAIIIQWPIFLCCTTEVSFISITYSRIL